MAPVTGLWNLLQTTSLLTMKTIKSPGMICLAAFLILTGLVSLFGINLGVLRSVPAILALVAGILILVGK
jgi:hypothetical protein